MLVGDFVRRHGASEPLRVIAPQADAAEHGAAAAAVAQPPTAQPRSQCSACPDVHTDSLEALRAHYRSAWHADNVRRLAHGRAARLLAEHDAHETDGSESDGDSSESSEKDTAPFVGSAFIVFDASGSRYGVFKTLVLSRDELAARAERSFADGAALRCRLAALAAGVQAVFLVRSGRVAAGVFDGATGRALAERTLKRYTTRRKQGGSQAARDASRTGAVHSAGASLRRAGEKHLAEDVSSLLASWGALLARATHIFWTDTATARDTLFAAESSLCASDPRLRKVPFTTYAPTLEELRRVHSHLFAVHSVASDP